jgi:hypothetical protein
MSMLIGMPSYLAALIFSERKQVASLGIAFLNVQQARFDSVDLNTFVKPFT